MLVLEALHVIPREAGLERGALDRPRAPWLDEAPEEIAFAPAVRRDVHRETERRETIVLCASHPVVDPGIVAAHIELEHAQGVRCCCGRFQPGLAYRREHLRHAEQRRGGAGL